MVKLVTISMLQRVIDRFIPDKQAGFDLAKAKNKHVTSCGDMFLLAVSANTVHFKTFIQHFLR